MKLVGRKKEQDLLLQCLNSKRPEFLVVYGRRRIGKTYLIKEFFNYFFSFYATGVANANTRSQLRLFNEALQEYGCSEKKIPTDWFEAFKRLKELLQNDNINRDPISGKRVIFLDELPWMDTAKSDFKSALDYFWNSWASSQDDLLLIVCGSATSWIIDNLLASTGGFYNRITRQIHLSPFSLAECAALCSLNELGLTKQQLIDCYMVFGGVPYYLNLLDKRMSLVQNIDNLIFNENGQLHYEYEQLFKSLFKKANKHVAIIEAMAKRNVGVLRTELASVKEIGDGESLTNALKELEQCGFIRKYKNLAKEKSGYFYQIIDPFTLFCITHLNQENIRSWAKYFNTPSYFSWAGNAFEIVCLNHIGQIKASLGISGIDSSEYSWRSKAKKGGAQIDLLIDRADGVINLCEMKHTIDEFVIDSEYEKKLLHKVEVFRTETKTNKAVHVTMITSNTLAHNTYSNIISNEITGDMLLKEI